MHRNAKSYRAVLDSTSFCPPSCFVSVQTLKDSLQARKRCQVQRAATVHPVISPLPPEHAHRQQRAARSRVVLKHSPVAPECLPAVTANSLHKILLFHNKMLWELSKWLNSGYSHRRIRCLSAFVSWNEISRTKPYKPEWKVSRCVLYSIPALWLPSSSRSDFLH